MKQLQYKLIFLLLGIAIASCNNNSETSKSTTVDSANVRIQSDDEDKGNTFSSNQYANDSTVTTNTDTTQESKGSTFSSNQYANDSVIRKDK
jgi:hypothetical protein